MLTKSEGWLGGLAALVLTLAAGNPQPGPAAQAAEAVKTSDSSLGPSRQTENPPSAVDLRPVFAQWGLTTRCQGSRGTCSVFTVTDAIEYALASRERQGTRRSVEFLNWASNQTTGAAADGGFFSDLWNGYAQFGICPEEDMPYLDGFDPAAQPSERARSHAATVKSFGLQLHWVKEWEPHRGLNDAELAGVKRALGQHWPVCGGFLWPQRERWEDGVLQMCPRRAVRDGHSVLLVGYRDDPAIPGGGLFLIRNTAGNSRDGMLTYQYVQAYMNDAVWIDSGARNPDVD